MAYVEPQGAQSLNTSTLAGSAAQHSVADLTGPEPISKIKRRWPTWLGALLSVLMIVGVGNELLKNGLTGLSLVAPSNLGFYLVFLLCYLAPPAFDFAIFRRLWGIPWSGMIALNKKRIANDVVLGYSGEAYFYTWARQRTQMVAAPFGAVKDVSILSAIAGNATTLALMAIALPLVGDLLTPAQYKTGLISFGVIIAMSLPFLIFSKRVFSLPRRVLWWVFGMHTLRIITASVLLALVWHFAMPEVSILMWLLLSVARMLVSRLPLVPNKDLLFANFAIIMIGQGEALSQLMALVAAATLLMHAVLIAGFAVLSFVRKDL